MFYENANLPKYVEELKTNTPYSVMRYVDHGMDNVQPSDALCDVVARWNETHDDIKCIVATESMFFDALYECCGKMQIPEIRGEMPHTDYTVCAFSESEMTALNARTKEKLERNSFMNHNYMELHFLEPDHAVFKLDIREESRKLIFENPECGVRYFWVKPSDVAIYVERGAADIGVAGKDILLEYSPDVYELLDLDIGKCRMAVAAKKGFSDNTDRTLRVATKFSNNHLLHHTLTYR